MPSVKTNKRRIAVVKTNNGLTTTSLAEFLINISKIAPVSPGVGDIWIDSN